MLSSITGEEEAIELLCPFKALCKAVLACKAVLKCLLDFPGAEGHFCYAPP